LSVISLTWASTRSAKTVSPGAVQENRTVVVDAKRVSERVRSSSTV
jgi:hypothetical protein